MLTRHAKAVATISPLANANAKPGSLIGSLKGRLHMAEDFNDLGPEWHDYTK